MATNVSARRDIVRSAKELGLNLSRIFEAALEAAVRDERRRRWRDDNRQAIAEYNERVGAHGVFSDGRRKF